jgi:cytosine/uracil/thiamine/allantoin permease
MPAVIANFDSRAAKFFVSFSFMLATIGNQIAAGSYPFSNDISGIAPKYINIFRVRYSRVKTKAICLILMLNRAPCSYPYSA